MRTKKAVSAVTLPTLSQAIDHALCAFLGAVGGRVKSTSLKRYNNRVKLFLRDGFDPKMGLRGSVELFLTRLKQANYSTSYVRAMKSVLYGFLAHVPTCQLSYLGVSL